MMNARTMTALMITIVGAYTLSSTLISRLPSSGEAAASVIAPAVSTRQSPSASLFVKMGSVIESPRCLNCHPADRHPTQGDDMHVHTPPMIADASGHGMPGLKCSACHSAANEPIRLPNVSSVPGNPSWALAPAAFAWQHKSLRDICLQIKDPRRNGNRSLAQIHEHVSHDALVAWAWHPGLGRKPAPMTQAAFGTLVQRWIDSGAQCPSA